MSKPDTSEKKKKGGSRLFIVMGAVALLAAGGGGAYAMMAGGMIPSHAKEDNTPRLVRKGDSDPYPSADGEEVAAVHGDGGSEYRTAYYSFADPFTSNLKGSDGLVQLSLAASTRRDGRVLMWMQQHELAIRSSILTVLADTPEEQLGSIEGKQALRKRLTAAINDELVAHEGFGGIDQVYFRSFIVQ